MFRPKVIGAEFFCIDTTVPYSDGGTWIVKKGTKATVKGSDGQVLAEIEAATRDVFVKITHRGDVEVR